MIAVNVIFDNNIRKGFVVSGHAEYADLGQDIVCAGVSSLVFTCINSMDEFLKFPMKVDVDDDTGFISCIFEKPLDEKSNLLFDSMLLGLKDIEENYGKEYLTVIDQEVNQ